MRYYNDWEMLLSQTEWLDVAKYCVCAVLCLSVIVRNVLTLLIQKARILSDNVDRFWLALIYCRVSFSISHVFYPSEDQKGFTKSQRLLVK